MTIMGIKKMPCGTPCQRSPCHASLENDSLPWRGHQMETFSTLLAFCVGNSPVTGKFPSQRPMTQSFDAFFDMHLNKHLSKQSICQWFVMPSCSLWHHCNVFLFFALFVCTIIIVLSTDYCLSKKNCYNYFWITFTKTNFDGNLIKLQ